MRRTWLEGNENFLEHGQEREQREQILKLKMARFGVSL